MAVIGVIAGIAVLINSPDAPSQFSRDDLPTQIQHANRMVYLVMGWSQIIGGITTGVFFYVVAGIGEAVLDLWKGQQDNQNERSVNSAVQQADANDSLSRELHNLITMSTVSEELLEIARTLDSLKSEFELAEVRDKLQKVQDASSKIAKSWSGSWLGRAVGEQK